MRNSYEKYIYTNYKWHQYQHIMYVQLLGEHVYTYLPESILIWLIELLADEGTELARLPVGEGGGGRLA